MPQRRIKPERIPELKTRLDELISHGEPGTWKYVDGHSDHTLSVEFDCSPVAIAKLRSRWFGLLKPNKKQIEQSITEQRLAKLESQVENFQNLIDNLFKRVVELEDTDPKKSLYASAAKKEEPKKGAFVFEVGRQL